MQRTAFHSVRSDHAQGLSLAVERLAELGHRRISLLVNSDKSWGNLERIRGYHEAVARLGLDSEPALLQLLCGGATETMAKALRAKPTAVIVSGEDSAIEANYALRLLGKGIPEDISLVTFESYGISRHMWPPNSTVDQDVATLADLSAELAVRIIDGDLPPSPVELISDNKFIERESTRRFG